MPYGKLITRFTTGGHDIFITCAWKACIDPCFLRDRWWKYPCRSAGNYYLIVMFSFICGLKGVTVHTLKYPHSNTIKTTKNDNFSHFINVKWVCFIKNNSFCTDFAYSLSLWTLTKGGFDSFENWFRFQQKKWGNRFWFLNSFTHKWTVSLSLLTFSGAKCFNFKWACEVFLVLYLYLNISSICI